MTYEEFQLTTTELAIDPETLKEARVQETAFTRDSPLTFSRMIGLQFDMRKTALQSRLNVLPGEENTMPISQQAYSARRALFDHTPFEKMVRKVVASEYSGQYALPLWNGYHIFAVDGSYAQLPPVNALRNEFGIRGGNRPSAGMSVLYDVLHGWPLDPHIGHTDMNEREQCEKHINFISEELPHIIENSIFTLDRGYPSAKLFKRLDESGIKFVARCSSKFLQEVNDAPIGETIVVLKNGISLRVIKFHLTNGEVATLATNLFDLPADVFPELYTLRWGIETFFFTIKEQLSLEKFTGKTPNTVRQDFWASMVIAIAVAIFQCEADKLVDEEQNSKNNKLQYRARTSNIIITMRDNFIFAALSGNPLLCNETLDKIVRIMARSKSAVRPGRSFPRNFSTIANAKLNLKSTL